MPAVNIVDRYQAIQYTGSNSAEIDAAISDFTIVSETGGVLTFQSPGGGSNQTASTNDWLRYTQGTVQSVHSPSAFTTFFTVVSVPADLGILAAGIKECPTLSPGNTVVSVDLTTTMPDTSYTPQAQIFAAAGILGSVSITSVDVNDADTVDVTVNNSGLVGLTGARILVTATA